MCKTYGRSSATSNRGLMLRSASCGVIQRAGRFAGVACCWPAFSLQPANKKLNGRRFRESGPARSDGCDCRRADCGMVVFRQGSACTEPPEGPEVGDYENSQKEEN